jgi:hypothetical protein
MQRRRRGLVEVQMMKRKVLLYLLPTILVQVACNLLFLSFSSTTKRCSNGNNNNDGNLIFDVVVARPQQQSEAKTTLTNSPLGSSMVQELRAGSNKTTTTRVDSTPHDDAIESTLVVGEATFLVSRKNLTSRFPAQSFRRLTAPASASSSQQQQRQQQQLITGVLSRAPNALQRQAIRDTWGYGHNDDVFFLVAGSWEDVADEFLLHSDLVWFDHPDEYYQITWSVMGFIYLVHTKIKTFGHVLKTDDDSYVKLEDLEQQLWSSASTSTTIDYGGDCLRGNDQGGSFYQDGTYPDYAAGYGYHLSSSFVSCIVPAMIDLPSINVEDANIGVFAHYCHVPCTTMANYHAHRPDGYVTPNTFLIQHRAKTVEDMEFYHRLACATANITNASCRLPRWSNNGAAGANNSTDDKGNNNATLSIALQS